MLFQSHMRIYGVVFALCLLLASPTSSRAQATSAVTVGVLLDKMQTLAEQVIETGFDRFDSSVVEVGNTLKSSVNSIRTNYEDSLDTTLDKVVTNERIVLSDLLTASDELLSKLETESSEIIDRADSMVNAAYKIVSKSPSISSISISETELSPGSYVVKIRGYSLTKVKNAQIYLDGDIVPQKLLGDDRNLTATLSAEDINANIPANEVFRIPVTATIEYCSWYVSDGYRLSLTHILT